MEKRVVSNYIKSFVFENSNEIEGLSGDLLKNLLNSLMK